MRQPSDLFRRLNLIHYPAMTAHPDDCALCGTEPGEKPCRTCEGVLSVSPRDLRANIHKHLLSIGDKTRAETLKRVANIHQAESKAGHSLKVLRLRSKLSQKTFSDRLGVAQGTLSKLEKTSVGPVHRIRHRLAHLVEQYGEAMPEADRRTLCKWANIPNPYQRTDPEIFRAETRTDTGPGNGKTQSLGISEEERKTPSGRTGLGLQTKHE